MVELEKTISIRMYGDLIELVNQMELAFVKIYNDEIIPELMEFYSEVEAEEIKANSNFTKRLTGTLKRRYERLTKKIELSMDEILDSINVIFSDSVIERLTTRYVNEINIVSKKGLESEIMDVVGVSEPDTTIRAIDVVADEVVSGIIETTIRETSQLIKSIPEEFISRTSEIIIEGLEYGRSVADIAEGIVGVTDITDSRARFIARDQLANGYGFLNKERNVKLGLDRFEWITSRDGDRVRPSHRKLDGKVFNWSEGVQNYGGYTFDKEVIGLIPGQDYNCRCTSRTVESDLLALYDEVSGGEV